MVKRILLPVDRSPRADAVAALVADTALGAHAKVRLLHVAPVPSAVQDTAGRIVIYADQELASVNSQGTVPRKNKSDPVISKTDPSTLDQSRK